MPYPKTRTQFAVFGPTFGSDVSSSNVLGTVPEKRLRSSREQARIARAFVW
jgi:hypothetical protein